MSRILAIVATVLFSISLCAQSINDVERLCGKALENAQNKHFAEALKDYDAAVAIIDENQRLDLVVNIDGDLVDYLVLEIAKDDPEKARQYAQKALKMRMDCLALFAKNGYFDSKEEYVDNISNEYVNIGYTLANAGLLDDAEQCFQTAVQVYPEATVFTQSYPLAQEVLGDFYTKHRDNPAKGLGWQYEAFQSAVSLFEMDSDISRQIFGRMITSYAFGLAFYSSIGDAGLVRQYPTLPIYSYEQIIDLTDTWAAIRNDIENKYGIEAFEELRSIKPGNTIGEERVRFGTPEHDALYKALAAIHYHQIDASETYSDELLKNLSQPEDVLPYCQFIITALRNNRYINNASTLYGRIADKFWSIGRSDLAKEAEFSDAMMMYSYGQYDYAWSKVSDLIGTIDDESYSPDYPTLYVSQLALLSNLYDRFKDNPSGAKKIMSKAISIASSNQQVDKRLLPVLYNNLSTIYEREKEYDKAIGAIESAIDYRRQWAIENDAINDFEQGIIWPALEYSNLAGDYMDIGEYSKAEDLLKKCQRYYETYYPESDPLLGVYDGLVYIYDKTGNTEKMLDCSEQSLYHLICQFLSNSQGMTKIQRTDYWSLLNKGFFDVNSQFALQHAQYTGLAYNSALIEKGLLVRYDNIIRNNVLSSEDLALKQAYNTYKDAESRGLHTKRVLEDRLMYLYGKHPEFYQSFAFHTWKDVQSRLSKQDLAIEFASCCSDGQNTTYAALILRNDSDTPIIVSLGSEDQFNRVLQNGAKAYRNNDALYALVWKSIEPYLSGVKNIYFSPQGALSQINIEVLENEKGKPINKLYNVYRVSSTGNLCEEEPIFKATSATLYGGLNYDTSTADLVASSRAFLDNGNNENLPLEIDSEITRKGWKYLPGTEKEVEQISRILDSKRIQLVSFTQTLGTEEAFKSMSGKSTPILHIATHGFFLSEKEAARSNPALRLREENDSHSYPLKRCGLILSGGQHAWLGEELPQGIEDGILTGEEIAGLDLSGTKLAVLSACQTGLGDLSRDGVYGLQRAFKVAGVETIIMSLWEVNDAATELMMTKFYSSLSSGKSKRDSFDAAIAAVKKEFDSPEYWAAFIMLD